MWLMEQVTTIDNNLAAATKLIKSKWAKMTHSLYGLKKQNKTKNLYVSCC